jgi:predicted dehydrogenase
MRILTGNKWREGYLDYHRSRREYRIRVLVWKNLEFLENVYHTRAKSIRFLLNYLPVVGPEGLWTKTWSRIREERRNEKYISCGVGQVMEAAEGGEHAVGDVVGFVAPLHPPLVERVVLPGTLVFAMEKGEFPAAPEGKILYHPAGKRTPENKWWKNVKGWSIYSGIGISEENQTALEKGLREELRHAKWQEAKRIDAQGETGVAETRGSTTPAPSAKKSGVLYGYGNYAKINIIPYAKPFVKMHAVHEIDPTQIFLEQGIKRWESTPFAAPSEKYDVYFVASYNHTHVPITLHALKQGAYVVVEKPVAMDYDELAALERALWAAGRKLFIGFHKRYGTFNRMALEDLGVSRGEPISYHSIVYELIQPEFFWYNWPVSRSTFFANGCHQIDHFLHLNNFSRPKDAGIKLLQDEAVEVWIELENGASFTTTFSEKGSLRVGPRDHVELKVHGRNVRITDAITYQSENNHRIIRKKRIYKTDSYRDMYREIGRKIANNEEGDTIESVLISTKLMLDLEEELKKMKRWGDKYERAKEEFMKYFKEETRSPVN